MLERDFKTSKEYFTVDGIAYCDFRCEDWFVVLPLLNDLRYFKL